MAFLFHVQLVLGYISFVFATILLIWSLRNEGRGVMLGSIVGVIVMILSVGSVTCAGYYGIKYLSAGVFEPNMVMGIMMKGGRMMPSP